MPGGKNYFFGLFEENKQIGFAALSNYVPHKKNTRKILHSNRIVIHPDYCGIGLARPFVNTIAKRFRQKGFRIMEKMSSKARMIQLSNDKNWALRDKGYLTSKSGGNMMRKSGFRNKVLWASFEFIG